MAPRVPGRGFSIAALPAGQVPVLFAADWCGYSRRFEPHFAALSAGFVVDISDEDDPLWDVLDIRVVPTVIVFEGGRAARRWAGVLGPSQAAEIRAHLSA